MKVIRSLKKIKRYPRPVVALGVFDGVHRGHRRVLKAAVGKAHRIKGTSLSLTFWPDPHKEKNLYSLEHRLRLIEEIGIDVCVVINFNKRFAGICALDFIREVLFEKIHANCVYVGKNFKFGKNARGSFKTLKYFSRRYNYKLKVFKVLKANNKTISSTYVRSLIDRGELKTAKRLLVRPVSILGTVVKGSSLGKKFGIPTANIKAHHEIIPPDGVYAAKIIYNDKKFSGICYIGSKPTFGKKNLKFIEVHIFNLKKDLYGKTLEIQFIEKIRKEKKFNSAISLVKQIKKDIKKLQSALTRH